MTNRSRGKQNEREIARLCGGKRVGIMGGEDIEHEVYSIECKSITRWRLSEKWLDQVVRNCPEGKVPLLWLHKKNLRHKHDLIILRYGDFVDLYGDLKGEHTTR